MKFSSTSYSRASKMAKIAKCKIWVAGENSWISKLWLHKLQWSYLVTYLPSPMNFLRWRKLTEDLEKSLMINVGLEHWFGAFKVAQDSLWTCSRTSLNFKPITFSPHTNRLILVTMAGSSSRRFGCEMNVGLINWSGVGPHNLFKTVCGADLAHWSALQL